MMTAWLDAEARGARPRTSGSLHLAARHGRRRSLGAAVRLDGVDVVQVPGRRHDADIEWLPRRVTLDNYIKVFEYPVLRWGLNSVIQATVSTFLCVLFGAMAGYALARMRFPGRDALFVVFLASLMIPTEVSVIPMLLGFIKVGWASSYQALILPSIGNVFSVYIFRQFFLTFPKEIEEAATMDGAGTVPPVLPDRAAARAGADDRRFGDHLHAQLEQLPLAAARHLRREHEDAARRHRRLHAGGRHAHAARRLQRRHGGGHDPQRAEPAAVLSSCSATSSRGFRKGA